MGCSERKSSELFRVDPSVLNFCVSRSKSKILLSLKIAEPSIEMLAVWPPRSCRISKCNTGRGSVKNRSGLGSCVRRRGLGREPPTAVKGFYAVSSFCSRRPGLLVGLARALRGQWGIANLASVPAPHFFKPVQYARLLYEHRSGSSGSLDHLAKLTAATMTPINNVSGTILLQGRNNRCFSLKQSYRLTWHLHCKRAPSPGRRDAPDASRSRFLPD